jgi:hypothetical protein
MVRRVWPLALMAVAACGGSDDAAPATTRATPATTGVPVAADLAPSQTAASTIAAPELPPPCTVEQLVFAPGASDEPGVLLVDITNTGDAWCEANLSASVAVAPEMEPDVWIDPGAVARLRVELDDATCDATTFVDTIGLDVNGTPVAVPIDPIDVCSLSLAALYPA